ncbi:MAG TPA: TonB family protein [Candidatus Baltobacteraceae bacterium]|jgi:TonB family protein|nr:TonB family protein [Candidatus Baltobacteraceae bacterium]
MTRVLVFAVTLAGAMLMVLGRAAATTEFCPGVLDYAPLANAAATQTYGIQLRALSERQLSARIVFDTSAGWFQADVPQTTLSSAVRTIPLRYPVDVGLAASPVMYVRFPSAVRVNHAFVTNALSIGDIFRWSDRGRVTCPLAPEIWSEPKYSFADVGALSATPDPGSAVLKPTARSPLEASGCADPFEPAKLLKQTQPTYPDAARVVGASGSAIVAVALNPNGSVADTWVEGSTTDATLDAAAQAAAQSSTFQGARAYCQSVPSIYYFIATFETRT